MTVELTMTNVITLVALVIMAMWALAKLLGSQQERRLDERFAELAKTLGSITEAQRHSTHSMAELERDFRRHEAYLEREFVRRDDYVRDMGGIVTRIDHFALRMERALEHLGAFTQRKGASDA